MNPYLESYQSGNLEYSLAFHCAPAIAGIKTANLLSLKKKRYSDWQASFRSSAAGLYPRGVCFYRLAECSKRVLLLAYNRRLLVEHLRLPANRDFLHRHGYGPGRQSLSQMLRRLKERMADSGGYPHEIGVFLGYPLADVEGFIRHQGESCKLCGYWKVYGDAEQAKRLFAAYDQVRGYFCSQVLDGKKIDSIHMGGQIT